jgi:predicted regulator of Ras-like GTPase activity (Roadblock/LC7/MglB family)
MDAAQALADLTEISAQIDGAVLADSSGSLVASTFAQEERGKELARAAAELLAAASEARAEGQELVQIQAATPRGSIFVVRDDNHVVAALTGSRPTVGLVFYDLKTCLRMLAREEAKPQPSAAEKQEPAAAEKQEPAAAEKQEPAVAGKQRVGKAAATRRKEPAKKQDEGASDESA